MRAKQGVFQLTPRFRVFVEKKTFLGKGSFGQVYRGYDEQMKTDIAVKIEIYDAKSISQKRQREIMELLAGNHPNIMGFYGYHISLLDKAIYYFLELVVGGTLTQAIAQGLSETEAAQLFRQLIGAMSYVNSRGIFHRDLKPDNILLSQSKQLKLADFGIARSYESSINFTAQRHTPKYAAPEQLLKNPIYDQSCDIWSAGYILYEMLMGQTLLGDISTFLELNQFHERVRKAGVGFQYSSKLSQFWTPLTKKMFVVDYLCRPSFRQLEFFFNLVEGRILKKQPALPSGVSDSELLEQLEDESCLVIRYIQFQFSSFLAGCIEAKQHLKWHFLPLQLFSSLKAQYKGELTPSIARGESPAKVDRLAVPILYKYLLTLSSLCRLYLGYSNQRARASTFVKHHALMVSKKLANLRICSGEKARFHKEGQQQTLRIQKEIANLSVALKQLTKLLSLVSGEAVFYLRQGQSDEHQAQLLEECCISLQDLAQVQLQMGGGQYKRQQNIQNSESQKIRNNNGHNTLLDISDSSNKENSGNSYILVVHKLSCLFAKLCGNLYESVERLQQRSDQYLRVYLCLLLVSRLQDGELRWQDLPRQRVQLFKLEKPRMLQLIRSYNQ